MTRTSPITLSRAVGTISHMLEATTLSTTNTTKTQELDEALAISLRDAVSNQDSLETSTFSNDETRTLASICSRIATLAKYSDMTLWMEDEDDGKQCSAWDIFSSILDRATLGSEQEEKVT
jgi:cohesin complex subunit SA-1/2